VNEHATLRVRAPAGARLALVALLGLTAASVGTAAAAAPSALPARVRPSQQLVSLLRPQQAMSGPSERSARVRLVASRRPLTGVRTTLPVVGQQTRQGLRWLLVRLPGRPNGRTAWIRGAGTVSSTSRWQILVDRSSRRVTVYSSGRPVRSFRAIVGKPSTPTPRGGFFVEEVIQLRSSDVGAPYALALSARSDVLQEFDGGPGQIGLHGLMNIGGVLGSAVSHGCVRLPNEAIRWLVFRISPGVPVTITR